MIFTNNRRLASPRTVRMLALQHTKIPGSETRLGLSSVGRFLGLNNSTAKQAPSRHGRRRVSTRPARRTSTASGTQSTRRSTRITLDHEHHTASERISSIYSLAGTSDLTSLNRERETEVRRRGMAVFSGDVREVLDELLRLEEKDPEGEELLLKILEGELVGGMEMYQRVKIGSKSDARVEVEASL
ncbi:hypothetical protein HMN09_00449500 [Mycena chlorophos]|uniref:Uncharacterized protein n=1 Tax=Mycena chlorophos TaxID=658473 RepID=A0A8H6WJG3_MYCCL|nr:hypothetical protein HMN09_00449500 [Mycena chlorophos]